MKKRNMNNANNKPPPTMRASERGRDEPFIDCFGRAGERERKLKVISTSSREIHQTDRHMNITKQMKRRMKLTICSTLSRMQHCWDVPESVNRVTVMLIVIVSPQKASWRRQSHHERDYVKMEMGHTTRWGDTMSVWCTKSVGRCVGGPRRQPSVCVHYRLFVYSLHFPLASLPLYHSGGKSGKTRIILFFREINKPKHGLYLKKLENPQNQNIITRWLRVER